MNGKDIVSVFVFLQQCTCIYCFLLSGALEKLEQCQIGREKVLYKDHKDLAIIHDAIAKCYSNIGQFSFHFIWFSFPKWVILEVAIVGI